MSESVDTAIRINASWRVGVVCGGRWGKTRAWLIQRMVDGVWHDEACTRSADIVRGVVLGRAGAVDADAAAMLADLPARSDHRGSSTIAVRGKKEQAAETRAAAAAALKRVRTAAPVAGTNRAAAAAAFLHWRAQQKENAAKG
jgi:hypothetical protein